jgi:hypothetical protein
MVSKETDRNQSVPWSRRQVAVVSPVVLQGCADPARMMELCYWSEEPGILEIIRGVAAMTSATQAALRDFLSLAPASQHIAAIAGHPRELMLFFPVMAEVSKGPRLPVTADMHRQGVAEQPA